MAEQLEFYVVIALGVLMLPLMFRLLRGPSTGDRLLAYETISGLGTLMLLAMSVIFERTIYLDLGMLLALFSFLGTLVIARYMERGLL